MATKKKTAKPAKKHLTSKPGEPGKSLPVPMAIARPMTIEQSGPISFEFAPGVGPTVHPFLAPQTEPVVLAAAEPLRIGSADVVLPCCRICGGEMKSNVCPADGFHLVDAP